MKGRIIMVGLTLTLSEMFSQHYTPSSVFAHNDYAQPSPFYNAYALRVGYIEADVFLNDDELFVAHQQNEIVKDKTLAAMYLNPLKKEVDKNNGWAFPDTTLQLKFMVDLKTDGIATLKMLVSQLKSFPALINAKGFEIFISGNVPSPDRWNEFPPFIHFDGRPGIQYSQDQLKRISLISTSFREHSKWNGEGEIPDWEIKRIDSLIQSVHAMGKKIRFWSIPDRQLGWSTLLSHKVDVIGTDHVSELVRVLAQPVRGNKAK